MSALGQGRMWGEACKWGHKRGEACRVCTGQEQGLEQACTQEPLDRECGCGCGSELCHPV